MAAGRRLAFAALVLSVCSLLGSCATPTGTGAGLAGTGAEPELADAGEEPTDAGAELADARAELADARAEPGDRLTDEFRSFLARRGAASGGGPAATRVESEAGGYLFVLENGRLSVAAPDGGEVWGSEPEWHVSSFRTGDVNLDGITDFVFVLWKSYSFGAAHPARMANDDASVRCHLLCIPLMGTKPRRCGVPRTCRAPYIPSS